MEFEPGVYPDMERDEYDRIVALNQSTIKRAYERHLAAAYYDLTHPKQPTQAMIDGQAFHTKLLEPEKFDERFALPPVGEDGKRVAKRGKANLAKWDQWNEEHSDHHEIGLETLANISVMVGKLQQHPRVGRWIENAAMKEFVVLWEHPDYGFPCKAQMDAVSVVDGWTWVWDAKKTKDAMPDGFGRQVASLGYLVQAEWYLQGLNSLGEADRRFAFVAVEIAEPFDIGIYELGPTTLFEARHRIDKICRKWADAMETGEFEGMPTGVQQLEAPRWAMTHEREMPEEGAL